MKLEWSLFALQDRDDIFDYIEENNPRAAVTVDEQISTQVDRLLQYPESGRPGRVNGTRELVVDRTPYIVAYILLGDIIRILRVLHSAQQWPENIPD